MKRKIINEKQSPVTYLLSLIITAVIGFVLYFFTLPALNITSFGFWIFMVVIICIFFTFNLLLSFKNGIGDVAKKGAIQAIAVSGLAILFIGIFIINFFLSPVFNSKAYANRIKVDKEAVFQEDIKKVDFKQLTLLDKDSSQKLGDRVMGQMPELVSQFYVSDIYTQINYNNDLLRVTPLEYNGFFKYLANRKDGIKGYITVNSVNGAAKLVKLEKGMKYMPSAILMENLTRKLRFDYPTKIFGQKTFELDNEGNPYWIIPTIKYSGVEIRKEIEGVIAFNPINGKSKFYDVKDVPEWIDHVYSPNLLIEQLDDWGLYSEGFLNSLFGQKNVVATTAGYNYTIIDHDVYLYTGITSVASDESNLGFVLSNLRTKETKFYAVPGAEEYSAMASAEGQVQQMKYTSTFTLLINLNGNPTYLVSLKDAAGLVKMYGFVDVVDYQKVVVSDASKGIEAAALAYLVSYLFLLIR